MKPYYQDEFVTIYHGESREILPTLPQPDIVLTDPPYGIDYQSARRIGWQRKDKIVGDDEFPLWLFDTLKPNNALFVFCRWDMLPLLPPPKSFIAWDKQRHSMGDLNHEYGRQWEAIAFYPFPNHQFTFRPKDIISYPCVPPNELLHPNEKPIPVLCQILAPNLGETIIDPFMGSGTTLLAAKKLNRHAIGIEIEEKYCEIAARRCSQGVMTLNIIPEVKRTTSVFGPDVDYCGNYIYDTPAETVKERERLI
jgi:site-specific DNA-methyltransferase (adenine-specific)